MSNVQNMHGRIGEEIIPAAFAANLPVVDDGIRAVCRKRLRDEQCRRGEKDAGGEERRCELGLDAHYGTPEILL
jgi:hypothetical protein